MTTEALRIAGPGSHLVARPAGVAHVYTGHLTPSGRYVPRSGQTACRARTRRLAVLPPERRSSLTPGTAVLCARCSVCLAASPAARQTEPTTRDEFRAAYAHLTPFDLAAAAVEASTADDIDQVAHLSLVLFGHLPITTPLTGPTGEQLPTLHQLVARHRQRITPTSVLPADYDDQSAAINAARRAERIRLRQEREDRIARLGFNNATRR